MASSMKKLPITESPDVVALLDKVPLTPMEEKAKKRVCCVTGSTGMVGSHVVRRLLRAGHTVHAPVRSLDEEKIGFLKAMPGADERLKLFKVTDLVEEGAYDESMAGCEAVLHVASPFFMVGSKEKIKETLSMVELNLIDLTRSYNISKIFIRGL